MRWFLFLALVGLTYVCHADDSKSWSKISTGVYSGYGESFARIKGEYVLDNGSTPLGVECEIEVSLKGIQFNGSFYPWDAPGFQASRQIDDEFERINIRGKAGAVIVVDLTTERPKGKKVSLLRMSLAQKKE